ncbi:MAG TPA: hypothetical protein VL404_04605 [Candidatus Eisenbacteria bacterium]|jgi:septal ring factor EnvC (AmiA/AmiB activator)|nr:hypothetical protein [Candidatus Eisenbacteria bacterium]
MHKKILLVPALSAALLVTGCATTGGRSPQADADALNARIAELQARLSEKESELAKLENRMREEEAARVRAESEKTRLSQKLDAALSEIENVRKAPAPKPAPPAPDSDLK